MGLLGKINGPEDIKVLPQGDLVHLAKEVRNEILQTTSKTGGHLASSLGVVELTIGLLRVFNPPEDSVVWDVGHQTYAWKILTGRRDAFKAQRQHGGMSGFPNPENSPYDAFVGGHAGVAIAAAEGIASARDRRGLKNHVVAVVGDASLTNGESLEALNNCTAMTGKLIIVVNDNAMSISRNVGSFARQLGRLLTGVRYNRVKAAAERAGHKLRLTFLRDVYHKVEQTIKSFWLGNALFESFGLRYIGPVDGHDMNAVEEALTVAREDKRSVVVHIVTVKGSGFRPAEMNPTKWHGTGKFDIEASLHSNGKETSVKRDWSAIWGEALVELAHKDSTVCALTAAMASGTGLVDFSQKFPKRFFDCGICEEYLVTFAAGLAKGGLKPFIAVYSSFLQRAVDQVMHDVCLQKLPVVIGIDRAGVVGADGKTHQGVFDIPMLRCLPELSILQPRSAGEMRLMLEAAIIAKRPVAIRYPRGIPDEAEDACAPDPIEWGKAEVLERGEARIQIWALGDEVPKARRIAALLSAEGFDAGVVNARFVKPLDTALLREQSAKGTVFVTLENGVLAGGFGEAIRAQVPDSKVLSFGWPDEFIPHGSVSELEEDYSLTAEKIFEKAVEEISAFKEVAK